MAKQEIRIGDCRELAKGLADNSIDCLVTSPPYWSLRDYKTEPIIFDGDLKCEHDFNIHVDARNNKSGLPGPNATVGARFAQDEARRGNGTDFCSKCGAWRGALGLEPTPELFIKHLADIFEGLKPKLKDTGSMWINLGDTYWGGKGKSGYELPHEAEIRRSEGKTIQHSYNVPGYLDMRPCDGKHQVIQSKCLCMIPERFAWEMINRGFILRNKIIWHKLNSMPESVTDRLSKTYEYIFHFVKQQKYWYDLDAIRIPNKLQSLERYQRAVNLGSMSVDDKYKLVGGRESFGHPNQPPKWFTNGANTGENNKEPYKQNNPHTMRLYQGKFEGNDNPEQFGSPRARTQRKNDNTGYGTDGSGIANHHGNSLNHPLGRNPGDTWNINTQPFSGAHFASFPLELVKIPIFATCPPYICKKCGKPRDRITQSETINRTATNGCGNGELSDGNFGSRISSTIGWSDCNCNAGFEPGVVLDPFCGSGTVLEFCRMNNRNAIGFELNPEYKKLAVKRGRLDEPSLGMIENVVQI